MPGELHVIVPPDVCSFESPFGCRINFARIEPPDVDASTVPSASSISMPPPDVCAYRSPETRRIRPERG